MEVQSSFEIGIVLPHSFTGGPGGSQETARDWRQIVSLISWKWIIDIIRVIKEFAANPKHHKVFYWKYFHCFDYFD